MYYCFNNNREMRSYFPDSKIIRCKNNLYSNKIVFIPVFIAFEFHELVGTTYAQREQQEEQKKKLYARYITQSNVSRPVSMIILWSCVLYYSDDIIRY